MREELAEERRARIAEATENKELRDAVNWLATEYWYIKTRIISTSCAVQARSFSTYGQSTTMCRFVRSSDRQTLQGALAVRGWLEVAPPQFGKRALRALSVVKNYCGIKEERRIWCIYYAICISYTDGTKGITEKPQKSKNVPQAQTIAQVSFSPEKIWFQKTKNGWWSFVQSGR